MGAVADFRRQIIEVTKGLPPEAIKEIIDFAQFLKTKQKNFSYTQIENSAEYLSKIRSKEGNKAKTGKRFINELIEWQRSNS